MSDQLTNSSVELLQRLIQNQCVNDGSVDSGNEIRNAADLLSFVDSNKVEIKRYEPKPGRASFIARLQGTDPNAKALCLMGHTDVVPVSADGWHNDPFGGELIDGEVWGRGAVDMLNLTSSMAVAFKHICDQPTPPVGDVMFFAVADEEAGGVHGAEYILDHHWEDAKADYVLTEYGGLQSKNETGLYVLINNSEKGVNWRNIKVKGTPGHGSRPYKADNALIKAAEVVRRIHAYAPAAQIDKQWNDRVDSLQVSEELRKRLKDPISISDGLAEMELGEAKLLHACSHTTLSPNVAHGGTKANVIPDSVTLQVDIRVMPGETVADIETHLQNALGDLYDEVEMSNVVDPQLIVGDELASASSTAGGLWQAVSAAVQRAVPEAKVFPGLVTGGTDARFYRKRGSHVLGAGLLSNRIEVGDFFSRFHGYNERIDIESLQLTTQLWLDVIDEVNVLNADS